MQHSSPPHLRPLRYATAWKAIGVLMMLVVMIIMVIPTPQLELEVSYADKWVHVAVFAVLGAWAAQIYLPSPSLWRIGIALIAFGATTELIQALIPWRSGDVFDLIADALGVVLGIAIAPTMLGRGLQWFEATLIGRQTRN